MSSYRSETRTTTVSAAIGDGYSEIQSLAEEMREMYDNMESGNLGQTQKCQTAGDTADILEGLDEATDIPEHLADLKVTWTESVQKRRGRSPSRAVRASNASAMLTAAAEAIRGWITDAETQRDEEQAAGNSTEELEGQIGEAEELADKLEEDASAAEGAEFPGMYG